MTPFDAVALLAMLLAFYPTVNASELARARRERPEYFAGGTLLGSKGDKLRLPDGRIFDLIQNAGGLPGQQRWQVIEPGPSVPEPWPLEAGPLTPIDVTVWAPPRPADETFESLVSTHLAELEGSDRVLDVARSDLAGGADRARELEDDRALDDGAAVVDEIHRSSAGTEIADLADASNGQAGAIDSTDNEYDEAPPDPKIPDNPEPVPYPDTSNNPPPGESSGPQPHDT
jgi:hypothetical protein